MQGYGALNHPSAADGGSMGDMQAYQRAALGLVYMPKAMWRKINTAQYPEGRFTVQQDKDCTEAETGRGNG